MQLDAPQGPVFFGEFDLSIDEKNRLLVPSEVRKLFDPVRDGKTLFMIIGTNNVPWFYPKPYYTRLAFQVPADMNPSEAQLIYDRMSFAGANEIDWDKQGRVLIPDKTLRRTKIGKTVTLIGVRDHLELWARDSWEAYQETFEQRAEIALQAKKARQAPMPSA